MIDTTASDHKIISLPSSTPYVDIKSTPTPESKELIFKSINVPSLPIPIAGAQACVIGDFIFIVGGIVGGIGQQSFYNGLVRFDPKFNTFLMMANMLKEVEVHDVVVKDNQIFVFGGGGVDDYRYSSSQNQCYDMKTNSWSLKTPMSNSRAALSATRIEDKIYVSGGFNDIPIPVDPFSGDGWKRVNFKIVEVYDVKTDSWEKIADMPGPKYSHRSINIGNKLYIFGGKGDDKTYVYDVSSKKWEQFPSLTEALPLENRLILHHQNFDVLALGDGTILPLSVLKIGAAVTAWQQRIFCFGGSDTVGLHGSFRVLNEVSSYLLLNQDLLNQAKTALPKWSGVYRSTSSQELIINEKGHVKFNGQDLFSMVFDVRTKTLYADKVGDTKDSFQSTFSISEFGVKSCEGPSFTGRREASVPVPIPPSRFSTEGTTPSVEPPSLPPGNYLLKFVTADVVRAGYDGQVKVRLTMEYKVTDEKGEAKIITKFTKSTQLGLTSFERKKVYSFFMLFEDDLDQSVVKTVEARTPKALAIFPESNFWGDQWHVSQIAVIDLTYNIVRLCNLNSEISRSVFETIINSGYSLTLGFILQPIDSFIRHRFVPYWEEASLEASTNNYLLPNNEKEFSLSNDFKQLQPEEIKDIARGLSVVYLWSFLGKFNSWGHVALGLSDGTYISWWPSGPREPVLPKFINSMSPVELPLYTAPARRDQTYEMDSKLEGLLPEQELKDAKPKHADITITIPDLDVAAIKVWWESFKNNPANKWETVGQNCAKTVCDALFHGGIYLPQYEDSMVREWGRRQPSRDVLYTPAYVQYLAYQIANDQFKRRSQPLESSSHPHSSNFSFMAMPRSIPDSKTRSLPENKYDREEKGRLNVSSSRDKDHQEVSPTTASDSPKLPPSVKLRYAMWGCPPPELMVKAPVQNERVLGK